MKSCVGKCIRRFVGAQPWGLLWTKRVGNLEPNPVPDSVLLAGVVPDATAEDPDGFLLRLGATTNPKYSHVSRRRREPRWIVVAIGSDDDQPEIFPYFTLLRLMILLPCLHL